MMGRLIRLFLMSALFALGPGGGVFAHTAPLQCLPIGPAPASH